MARENILLVEDDDNIAELVRFHMEKEEYSLHRVADGRAAVARVAREEPDLVLLDLMLPHMDGLEVCRRLKSAPETAGIPVLMVTARGAESDIVAGLELGAEDYITKPFKPRELVARVRAALRRAKSQSAKDDPAKAVSRGDMEIHPGRREVRIKGKPVDLTFTEFEVLLLLARRPGWVFTRSQIVDGVRGSDYAVTERSVDVQVVGLRKKLGSAADVIETVRGVGYRMRDESE